MKSIDGYTKSCRSSFEVSRRSFRCFSFTKTMLIKVVLNKKHPKNGKA